MLKSVNIFLCITPFFMYLSTKTFNFDTLAFKETNMNNDIFHEKSLSLYFDAFCTVEKYN